jgi:hypothetical protein
MYALNYPATSLVAEGETRNNTRNQISHAGSATHTHRGRGTGTRSDTSTGSDTDTTISSPASIVVHPSAPVQLIVHGGGWKVAARRYGRWLRSIAITNSAGGVEGSWDHAASATPPMWLDEVHTKSSAWVPDAATVAKNKQSGQGFSNFEDLYAYF